MANKPTDSDHEAAGSHVSTLSIVPGAAPAVATRRLGAMPCLPEQPSYAAAVNRVLGLLQQRAPDLVHEQAEARGLLGELANHSPEQQLLLVSNSSRFQSWKMGELLLDRCQRQWFDDPRVAHHSARLAVAVAERLDVEHYGRRMIADLKALGWAYLANSCRIAERLPEAKAAIHEAQRFIHASTGDALMTARIDILRAMVRFDCKEEREAQRVLARVLSTYRALKEDNLRLRGRLSQAVMLRLSGKARPAHWLLQELAKDLRGSAGSLLWISVHHHLGNVLLDLGDSRRAERHAVLTRDAGMQVKERILQLRRDWFEGRLACQLGNPEQAEALLQEVRAGFQDLEKNIEAARVGLDLGELYAAGNQLSSLRTLLREIEPQLCGRVYRFEARRLQELLTQAGLSSPLSAAGSA